MVTQKNYPLKFQRKSKPQMAFFIPHFLEAISAAICKQLITGGANQSCYCGNFCALLNMEMLKLFSYLKDPPLSSHKYLKNTKFGEISAKTCRYIYEREKEMAKQCMYREESNRPQYDVASISRTGSEKRANYIQDALHVSSRQKVSGQFVKVFSDIFLKHEAGKRSYI